MQPQQSFMRLQFELGGVRLALLLPSRLLEHLLVLIRRLEHRLAFGLHGV